MRVVTVAFAICAITLILLLISPHSNHSPPPIQTSIKERRGEGNGIGRRNKPPNIIRPQRLLTPDPQAPSADILIPTPVIGPQEPSSEVPDYVFGFGGAHEEGVMVVVMGVVGHYVVMAVFGF
jgi:hypothetical protein